jgi:Protein of unknown function (DUF2752)
MLAGSFRVSIAERDPSRLVTAPMMFAGLALAAAVAARLTGLDRAGFAFCYFKALTGYACFTCGATRALAHLARFDLSGALAVQPLVTVSTLGLVAWGLLDALLLVASKRTELRMSGRVPVVAFAVGAALVVLNWLYLLATGV